MQNWQDVNKAVLSDHKKVLQVVANFTYENIMDIPQKTILQIQRACNEDYMDERFMSMKSRAVAILVRFLKNVIGIREDISKDPRLRRYIVLNHIRRTSVVNQLQLEVEGI